ncbi:zinc-dependent alcohol dehydrogenase family protein [Okibacterium endophyticum]
MPRARAAVLRAYNTPFHVAEVEFVDPADNRMLIRTGASPFCVTDILSVGGKLGKNPPSILGHSSMGIVEAVGAGVTRFSVGQRVVVPGTPECGRCFYCGIGRPDQCSELFDLSDGYYKVAVGDDGIPIEGCGNVAGYAELMNVSQNQVWPLETDLSDEVLSMFGCGVTTGLGAVFNVAQVQQHESVVVVGAGQLGLWAVQGARLAGAAPLIVIEPIAGRRELAGRLGADHVIDPGSDDVVSEVKRLTGGRGADHVIETAGPAAAQESTIQLSRRAGTIVLTGVTELGTTVELNQIRIAPEGRRILGCQNGNVRMSRDIPRYARLIEEGKLDPSPIITRTYGLAEINEAMANSGSHSDVCGIIIPSR